MRPSPPPRYVVCSNSNTHRPGPCKRERPCLEVTRRQGWASWSEFLTDRSVDVLKELDQNGETIDHDDKRWLVVVIQTHQRVVLLLTSDWIVCSFFHERCPKVILQPCLSMNTAWIHHHTITKRIAITMSNMHRHRLTGDRRSLLTCRTMLSQPKLLPMQVLTF